MEFGKFYLVTKYKNLGSSAIHLVGVDMIEIANSIFIIITYFLILAYLQLKH